MGSVDVTIRGHRHRLIITFTTMKFSSVTSLGAIIGQADNVIPNVMQSVLAHPNNGSMMDEMWGVRGDECCRST